MPCCEVHYLWFAFVCSLTWSQPPRWWQWFCVPTASSSCPPMSLGVMPVPRAPALFRDLVAAEDRAVEPVPRRTALGIVGTVAGLAQGALPTEAAEDGAAYTEGPEGLLFSDDKVGTGLEPIEGDVVTCNYEGSLVATGTRYRVSGPAGRARGARDPFLLGFET